ncbi:MAG: phenylalanine--tRNA ligase subunit alpha [Clostridiales bacterium]|jgi:phenylalanyl-tRNA synthetase alpha chain|nr:phenylalanine--tRNA ligase subunit alpha [Clostridiales bacterium]
MKQKLDEIKTQSLKAISSAGDPATLESLRVKYLGKKGELTGLLKQMGSVSEQERPVIGRLANSIRQMIEDAISQRSAEIKKDLLEKKLCEEALDVTIPGKSAPIGKKHPLYIVWDEVADIFISMGYSIEEGPEVELSDYCFTRLNTPVGHPARDRQDTFYLTEQEDICLRTQTSSVQIRVMEKTKPPIRIISPGRVYRKDEVDATHSPMFHQVEGLVVDKGITMGDLKGTLNTLMKGLFGPQVVTRFRPHHFPYTEPSCEVDVQCFECRGKGCRVCKNEGWIELLGAGMVHPKVLEGCGIDPDVYSGFAFGIGIERLTMRRFNIQDLRLLYENDVRFLSQF